MIGIARGPAGSELAYETEGDRGDPTVLVHGAWSDRTVWREVAGAIAPSLRVLTYDRRGYGGSRGPPRTHPVRQDAEDLADLLQETDLYPAHVVAQGFGALVALRLAGTRPELVRSLVLHEPPCFGILAGIPDPLGADWDRPRRLERVRAMQAGVRWGRGPEVAASFFEEFAGDVAAWEALPPERRAAWSALGPRWVEEVSDPEADRPDPVALAEYVSPALVTVGSRAPRVLAAASRTLADRLGGATTLILPGVGHWPALSHPSMYAAVLLRFLAEREVPSM
ncbi:MAG: alpha/beta hydrolase [Thermoplasmata archaeon]